MSPKQLATSKRLPKSTQAKGYVDGSIARSHVSTARALSCYSRMINHALDTRAPTCRRRIAGEASIGEREMSTQYRIHVTGANGAAINWKIVHLDVRSRAAEKSGSRPITSETGACV